jgi:UDP-N-acetylglucosamine diphosphorylase / glucose-1-phosphate thymidylyltransferase / UDP-N-acetylgalactosamine diphosphorylase / glucosamine-1-phosphate N-acetyltransferase / galactosamine-1-phosphate N-acetyltransferase
MDKTIIIREGKVEHLYPITLTRPAYDIKIGGFTLFELIKKTFPNNKIILITLKERQHLMNFIDNEYKEELTDKEIKNKNYIEIDATSIPNLENIEKIKKEQNNVNIELNKINYPHEIISLNKKYCNENLNLMIKLLKNNIKFNQEHNIYIGKDVKISKFVVFDNSKGPIIIDDNTSIGPFCFIKGPVYIGKNCKINEHSSIKDNTIIGNTCKIGGEIEESIILDYSNKQHYGYLGNSFLGSWVNLGAGTSTSDLKNTYGFIKVKDGLNNIIKTKEQFLGSIIGDYSKTAINTSLYTGKIIGINCVLYGIVEKDVVSFINYSNNKEEFLIDKAIETQKRMFERRKKNQTNQDIEILNYAFNETKNERDLFLKK